MDAYDIFHKLTLGAVFKKQVKVDDKVRAIIMLFIQFLKK